MKKAVKEMTYGEYMEIAKKIYPYMRNYGWEMDNLIEALVNLDVCCGMESSKALSRFVDKAKEDKKEDGYIAGTIGHDLKGAGSKCFCPRTSSY